MPTAEELGLESPVASPAGAVDTASSPPVDVMEAPSFAYAGSGPPDPGTAVTDVAGFLGAPGAGSTGTSGVAQTQTSPVDPSIWESDQNPYRQAGPTEQQQQAATVQNLRGQLAALPQQTEMALMQLIAGGVEQTEAQRLVTMSARAAEATLRQQLTEAISAPAVRTHVAADIARRFSLPGSPIDPAELGRERTVSAMEARARTLQETRRTTAVQARTAARADTVETAPGASGPNRSGTGVSPFMMIRSGLSRRSAR